MDVWRTYVVFYILWKKSTAICKYMYEGPAVAFKPQGPEGPWSGPGGQRRKNLFAAANGDKGAKRPFVKILWRLLIIVM